MAHKFSPKKSKSLLVRPYEGLFTPENLERFEVPIDTGPHEDLSIPPYEIVSNFNMTRKRSDQPPILLVPGFGERPERTLVRFAQFGTPAVSACVDFSDIPRGASREHLTQQAYFQSSHALLQVIEFMRAKYKYDKQTTLVANSLGGLHAGHMIAADEEGLVGDLALINPVGLNNIQGSTRASAAQYLALYASATALVTPPWRRGLHHAAPPLINDIATLVRKGTFMDLLDIVNDADIAGIISKHSETNRVAIISSVLDGLNPPHDIAYRLSKEEVGMRTVSVPNDIQVIPGNQRMQSNGLTHFIVYGGERHANLDLPNGIRLSRLALDALNLR